MRERNMLYSTRMLHRKNKTTMPHPDRLPKVRKSMAMVKLSTSVFLAAISSS